MERELSNDRSDFFMKDFKQNINKKTNVKDNNIAKLKQEIAIKVSPGDTMKKLAIAFKNFIKRQRKQLIPREKLTTEFINSCSEGFLENIFVNDTADSRHSTLNT